MNKNTSGITIALVAIFAIAYTKPIKPEENSKDIEVGVMENLEGMFKNYEDSDIGDEYDFELDLDGANSHGLGYYKLESEPIYLPKKKDGLFDKFPKIDLFDKFHKFDKFDSQPQIQPIYDNGQYQQKYDKFPKFDLFDKFHKFDKFDKFHSQPQIQPIYDYGQYQQKYDKFPKFDLFDKFHKFDKFNKFDGQPQIQPIYDYGQYDIVAVPVKLKKCGLFGCKFNKKF